MTRPDEAALTAALLDYADAEAALDQPLTLLGLLAAVKDRLGDDYLTVSITDASLSLNTVVYRLLPEMSIVACDGLRAQRSGRLKKSTVLTVDVYGPPDFDVAGRLLLDLIDRVLEADRVAS